MPHPDFLVQLQIRQPPVKRNVAKPPVIEEQVEVLIMKTLIPERLLPLPVIPQSGIQ